MYQSKHDLEKEESRRLAKYAVHSSKSQGRAHPETVDDTRTEFQRDRDRIIHSKAFRRLSGKTQVFVATYGDHFRDRLSHSLEVAQVARDLARNLALNEDMVEAISLAHDLGHTPFGHAGEHTLNEIMGQFGEHFEHNEQSLRIVEVLERQFPKFPGLNLTYEVRQGLAKHQTLYDQRTKKITGKTLEAQIVDIADEIAYHNHDLDDGLRSELFRFKDLEKLSLWKKAKTAVEKKYGKKLPPAFLKQRTVSQMISLMINDVLSHTSAQIKKLKIVTLEDVLKQKKNIAGFSPSFSKLVAQVRAFLWKRMYQSKKVITHSRSGQQILVDLFQFFLMNPKYMPQHFIDRINEPQDLPVAVKDYLAGMTDVYATEIYEQINQK